MYKLTEKPVLLFPSVMKNLGVHEAIFLDALHSELLNIGHVYNGKRWVFKSLELWHLQLPYFSKTSIRRIIQRLEVIDIIETEEIDYRESDGKWYTIHYETLNSLLEPETSLNQLTNDGVKVDEKNPFLLQILYALVLLVEKLGQELIQNEVGEIEYMARRMNYWGKVLPKELVIEAILRGVRYKAKSWAYVEKILQDWRVNGYHTNKDIQSEIKSQKRESQSQAKQYFTKHSQKTRENQRVL